MMVLQATIGRNIGESPMLETEWRDFRGDVQGVLETFCTGAEMFLEEHLGRGEWTDEKTGARVHEESAKIAAVEVSAYDLESIRDALEVIAENYEQDMIAVTVSTPIMVARRSRVTASARV